MMVVVFFLISICFSAFSEIQVFYNEIDCDYNFITNVIKSDNDFEELVDDIINEAKNMKANAVIINFLNSNNESFENKERIHVIAKIINLDQSCKYLYNKSEEHTYKNKKKKYCGKIFMVIGIVCGVTGSIIAALLSE
jgi:hypothetical protein